MFLVGYGADDWSDSYHHDYQYEINQAVEAISKKMRGCFADWVRQLNIPDADTIKEKCLKIDKTAIFLNFNYTPSLQKLYDIPSENILHIHGKSSDITDNIVLGHGWEPTEISSLQSSFDEENEDVRFSVISS
ncbi:MAG: AbiH family protein [Alphaproteobacteria bacterium]